MLLIFCQDKLAWKPHRIPCKQMSGLYARGTYPVRSAAGLVDSNNTEKICVSLQSKKTIIELEDTYHVQPVDVGFMFSGTDAEIQVLEVCHGTK